MSYVAVWVLLAVLTLAEVGLAWVHTAPRLMLALLLMLSFVKAGLIAWWFMHLRSGRPRALLALLPVVLLFIASLTALLPDGVRSGVLR